MSSHLTAPEHFSRLLDSLTPEDRDLYDDLQHLRTETGYSGRQFVLYSYDERLDVEDVLTLRALDISPSDGAWTSIHSRRLNSTLLVEYTPVALWDYEVFIWLPLHFKLRWDVKPSHTAGLGKGQLSYPICVRTRSRFGLRESGVDYMESMRSFYEEFGQQPLAV